MTSVKSWLNASCGIPLEDMVGMRDPFLINSPGTRRVQHDMGLLYDATINEHWEVHGRWPTSANGSSRLWPCELSWLAHSCSVVDWCRLHHRMALCGCPSPLPLPSSLWDDLSSPSMPDGGRLLRWRPATALSFCCCPARVPPAPSRPAAPAADTMDHGIPQVCEATGPDGSCTKAERWPGLWEVPLWVLQTSNYPMDAYAMDPGGDVFQLLKINFDAAYSGNRAPIPIYMHKPWMVEDSNQKYVQQFMDYALQKGDVWFVTMHQLIDWMRNPIPKSEMKDKFNVGCQAGGSNAVNTKSLTPVPAPAPPAAAVPSPSPPAKPPTTPSPPASTPAAPAPTPAPSSGAATAASSLAGAALAALALALLL
ncbi:hypothetical protein ABPG75_003383 [Micractinium tetrahymenae]